VTGAAEESEYSHGGQLARSWQVAATCLHSGAGNEGCKNQRVQTLSNRLLCSFKSLRFVLNLQLNPVATTRLLVCHQSCSSPQEGFEQVV